MTTAPVFGSPIADAHTRIDTSTTEHVYVVGDVHGCLAELRQLWDRLDPGSDDRVVFVGDLVRKGPASDGVVEFVRRRENAISVRGNNEQKLLRGAAEAGLSAANREAIESFPLVVSWGEKMAVHGGVHPDRPLEAHAPDDLLEMRAVPAENGYDGPFWFELHDGPRRVFFGHTPLADPFVDEWAVGLDTGCVYGGALTAYDCTREKLVSVPAERTYQHRPEEKILDV
jgi:serine/threonine protein phosphatase 1